VPPVVLVNKRFI